MKAAGAKEKIFETEYHHTSISGYVCIIVLEMLTDHWRREGCSCQGFLIMVNGRLYPCIRWKKEGITPNAEPGQVEITIRQQLADDLIYSACAVSDIRTVVAVKIFLT